MKYAIRFSCGHERSVELYGKVSERERKICWYGMYGVCPDCKTKSGSYNGETKTIIVYVPVGCK